jgi:hypothetical protein
MPFAAELRRGRELLERVHGRCDLVLHGHRHVAGEDHLVGGGRPLRVMNAGATGELGSFVVVSHAGREQVADRRVRIERAAPGPLAHAA